MTSKGGSKTDNHIEKGGATLEKRKGWMIGNRLVDIKGILMYKQVSRW